MATATPSPTPNPNALRFALDVKLPGTVTASAPADSADPFVTALLGIEGVASIFGTGDFITVTRQPGADWETIIPAVQDAAATHL